MKKKRFNFESAAIRYALIIILILSIGVLIGSIGYTLYKNSNPKVLSYKVFEATANIVVKGNGMNGDTAKLAFGKVSQGGGGTRYLNITADEDCIVNIYASGDLAKYISVENNNITMMKGQTIILPVNLDVPKDATPGNFTARVHVFLLRP